MKNQVLNRYNPESAGMTVSRVPLLLVTMLMFQSFVSCSNSKEEGLAQVDENPPIEAEEEIENDSGYILPSSGEPKSESISYDIKTEHLIQKDNSIFLLSDGNLFSYTLINNELNQVTQSGKNIIDFAYSPSANKLAILYSDPAITADLVFEGFQSTYVGTELIIVEVDSGSILRRIGLNANDFASDQNDLTIWSHTRKGIVLHDFNPYDPTSLLYSIHDQLIYWDTAKDVDRELPVFGGFPNDVMWSQDYFVLAYSEWEGISFRVFNIESESVQQNELTEEEPFFVYQRGDKVLGFLDDTTLVSTEITGSDLSGEYYGVVRLFNCTSSSLITEYDVEDPRGLFICGRKLLTPIDPFSTDWPLLSNISRKSESELSEVVSPDSINAIFDFKWIPEDIALYKESFIFKDTSDVVLVSGFKREDDGTRLQYLLIYDSNTESIQVIKNVGYSQYSWLN